MGNSSLTDEDVRRYRANVAALEAGQPDLVRLLDGVEIPAFVERTIGRDGSDTFRIHHDGGSWEWFGRSSMPTVSAPAVLADLHPDGRNVILPAIGTGREAVVAIEHTASYCAVFVFERDPLALKLALHLVDLAELIRGGRLVLLCGPDAIPVLTEFFTAHSGFEFPQRMMPLPVIPQEEQERVRLLIESAVPRVAQVQWTDAGRAVEEFKGRTDGGLPGEPRVTLLSRDPRGETLELAERLRCTLERMSWPVECSVPDRPDRCHTVARLHAVCRHGAELVVLLNCLKGPLRPFLPPGLPMCSWLTNTDSIEVALREGLEGNEAIFVARPAMIRRLEEAGATAGQLRLLECGVGQAAFRPVELDESDRCRLGCDVAIPADGWDVRPAALHINLASHVRLWEESRKIAAGLVSQWQDGLADEILERASRTCEVRLVDTDLRRRFSELIRRRLVPMLLARAMAERLSGDGLRVTLWGHQWETYESVEHLARGPIGPVDERNLLYNAATVVLLPVYHDDTARTVLECLAAGGCPVFRRPEQPLDELHPQLAEVFDVVPAGGSLDELAERVREMLADADRRASVVQAGRALVLGRHTLEHRLRHMRDNLATR